MALFPAKKIRRRSDETRKAKNYSRLNYGDEKCSQQYISFLGNKYCRVAKSRTISEFPILRFRSRDFAIMKIQKCLHFIVFYYLFFKRGGWKKRGYRGYKHRTFYAFFLEGDCVFNVKNSAQFVWCKISDL